MSSMPEPTNGTSELNTPAPVAPSPDYRMQYQHVFTSTDGDTGIELGPKRMRVWIDGATILHTNRPSCMQEMAAHLIDLARMITNPHVDTLLHMLVDNEYLPGEE